MLGSVILAHIIRSGDGMPSDEDMEVLKKG
jgi:DNA repair protein RadC